MAIDVNTAITRLKNGYWNKNSVSEANPGGMGAGGHVENLPALAEALGVVGEYAGTQGNLASEVLAIQDQINAVVAASDDIVIVAEDIAAVLAAAANMAAIIAAPTHAATATAGALQSQRWAETAEDVDVPDADPGSRSALHYAAKSEEFAGQAQAAVGGVRVSAEDTIAGALGDKVEVAGGIEMEIVNPGAAEKLRLTVPPLTDLISNSMALAWNVVELQGASLSGYANMVVDAFEDQDGIDAGESDFAVYDSGQASWKSLADSLSLSYVTTLESTSSLSTYTFAAASLGTASALRHIVVAVASRNQNASVASGVTVAGIAATLVVESPNPPAANAEVSMWRAPVPEGSTGDIVVTFSNGQAGCAIGVWALYGVPQVADSAAVEEIATSVDLELSAPAGSAAIAFAFREASASFDWTGATKRFDTASSMGIPASRSGADATYSEATEATINVSAGSSANLIALAAAFEPVIAGARELVSVALTAASDPASLFIGAEIEVPAPITLGTDLMLYGSIDDGATWEEVAAYQTYAAAGGRLLVFGVADVTGQTGTDVRIRAATAEGEIVTIHKWGVQADVALTPPA